MDERLKEAAEDADREKALKDVVVAIAKDKGNATKAVEKKARALVEKRLAEMDMKLGGMELKLAEAKSLNLAKADEIADLKVALKACKEKWYNGASRTQKISWSPLYIKLGGMGSRRDGWTPLSHRSSRRFSTKES